MSFLERFAILLLFSSLALILPSYAQNSVQDYLDGHNAARAAVGVGPLRWNETVAAYALRYANSRNRDCSRLVHSNGPYGENLAAGSSSTFSGRDAVKLWVDEKQFYNYNTNTCAQGRVCGHYTQVVWRSSTSLGCARTPCNGGGWYVICSYYPRGNYNGQRPY